MLSLLLSSELHRNALLKILNQMFVPKEISVDNVDRLIGNIAMDNFLSFSDEEIPVGGRGSHKALHITTRCKGYMLPGVLVDNGSALNVLPLATLKKLPIDSTHMKPYQNTAEEDIIASISSDTPYIEVDEDAIECTFRSLELVNATFVEENKRMTRFGLSRCAKMQTWKEGGSKEKSEEKESKVCCRRFTMG
ncbi:hypothetical protein V6N13_033050 [Hibiscus sabdariffa]